MPFISTRKIQQDQSDSQNLSTSSMDSQRSLRLQHLEELKNRGIDAFPVVSQQNFNLEFTKFWFNFIRKENLVAELNDIYKDDISEVSEVFITGIIYDIFYKTQEELEADLSLESDLLDDGLSPEEAKEQILEENKRNELIARYRELFPTLDSLDIQKKVQMEQQFIDSLIPADDDETPKQRIQKNTQINLVGRLKTKRTSGKIAFGILEDESLPSGFQCIFKKDVLEEEGVTRPYNQLTFTDFKKIIDEGDYLQVTGVLEYSQTGEPSLFVDSFVLLTKSLRPLPVNIEYDNVETRYLDRVADLKLDVADENGISTRDIIKAKETYWNIWREELKSESFTEVECPIFEQTPGGADAKPFSTFYNELDQDMYLRISLELPLKKLIAGGFERVFEIGRIFRNEGSSPQHLQEYTQLEWYWAYSDYYKAMPFVQRVFRRIVTEILGTDTQVDYHENEINWGSWCTEEEATKNGWGWVDGWPTIKYHDAVRYFSDGAVDMEGKNHDQLLILAREHGVEIEKNSGTSTVIDKIYKKVARPKMIQPFFLIEQPVELEPLAKRSPENSNCVQRCQLVAGTAELAKFFSELNDPIDQFGRFDEQQKARDSGDEEAQFMNEDYVKAMEYGMPPMSGMGVSERVVSFLFGKHIKECVTFPYTRIEESQVKKAKKTLVAHAVILDTPDIPMWSKLNAAAHLAASFASRVGKKLINLDTSESKDGETIPMNIQHAIVMKQTDQKLSLLELKHKAEELNLMVSVFTEEMRESSDDAKVEFAHSKKSATDIGYLGVLVFGKKGDVEKLTDKFDLID